MAIELELAGSASQAAIPSNWEKSSGAQLRQLDPGLPVEIEKRYDEVATVLFPSRMASLTLGVMGVMGAMLSSHWHLRNGSLLGQQAAARVGHSGRARGTGKEVVLAALGRAFKLLAFGSAAGLLLGILASRVLARSCIRPHRAIP